MPTLTQKTVHSTPAPTKGATRIWDNQVPGLHLEIRPSGARTFRYKYREATDRQRTISVGRVGELTLTQARKIAQQQAARVRLGESPADDRQQARQAVKLDEAASHSLDGSTNLKQETLRDYWSQYRRYVKPTLGRRPVASIERGEIARVLDRVPGHVNRNRVRAVLSRIMSHALRRGHINTNPVQSIPKAREKPREDWLSADQLQAVWQACESEDRDTVGAASIQLMMLTGCRKREALRARWEDFDLQRGVWSKPQAHTKSGKRHTVYLDSTATALLQRLKASADGPHVFPSNMAPDRPRVDIRVVWDRIQERAGLTGGYRLHDIRHSFASLLAARGVPATAIQQLLGHSCLSVTQRYVHGSEDALRQAVESHGVGNVVDLSEYREVS